MASAAQTLPDWSDPLAPAATKSSEGSPMAAPPTPVNGAQVPVDGGLVLLVVAGLGYGARQLMGRDD